MLAPKTRSTEALNDFKTVKVRHPRLEEMEQFLLRTISGHRSYTLIDLYGASGVGKSTIIEQVAGLVRTTETNPAVFPVVIVQASPEDVGSSARLDYYQQILGQLQHYPAIRDRTKNLQLYINPGKRSNDPAEWLEMRNAVEYAFALLRVRVVFVDEAQHLLAADTARKPTAQLDWLKALTNRTNVLHVLVGNFDLYECCHLNGQVVRRMRDQHFPRYHLDTQKECEEFVGALKSLLECVPLTVDVPALLTHWRWFGEWSVGCVGILGDWMVETVDALWGEGETTLTIEALTRHALQPDQRARLEMEARTGENRVARAKAKSELELQQLLGPPALDTQPIQTNPGAPSTNGTGSGRRGDRIERAPSRDVVGENVNVSPPGKCPGSGQVLDLEVHRFTRSAVIHVQCLHCGSIRKGLLKKDHIVCPPHEKLRGRSTHTGPFWAQGEAGWEAISGAKKGS
ncbi:MAG: TniB family NTP-binding protein [Chloroflexota bacterium]|nr:TniB family NTP-binding protein [Chloroflexota bacterium]